MIYAEGSQGRRGIAAKVQTGRRAGEPVHGFNPHALRQLRQAAELTLDSLGERAQVSRSSLIAYENGSRRPGLETMRSLAGALGVELSELTRGAPDQPGLRDLRVAAGLTKTELAGRLGLARNTWDLMERGTRPVRPERVAALAECLGVDGAAVTAAARAAQRSAIQCRASGGAPAPEVGFASSSAPGRLDRRLSIDTFIGRDGQLAELRDLITRSRLLTLTGTAGVGKTRLAMELGRRVATEYADGVWVVELASTRDASRVPQAVATALGLWEQPGRSLAEALRVRLHDSRLLLVMDNCEHVSESCAELVGSLLEACPGVSCLATSQRPLAISGEQLWAVPPLAVPDPRQRFEVLGSSEAVKLFCERAAANRGGFSLNPRVAAAVAEICHRLDGIPLAIELAAARIGVLTPAEIAAHLDDRFALLTGGTASGHHQTLRALADATAAIPALKGALEVDRESGDLRGQARLVLLLANAQDISDPTSSAHLFEQNSAAIPLAA